MTVPLAAVLYSSVSWRPGFPLKSMAGPSRLAMTTFAPGTERLPKAHARADVSSPPVTLQLVALASLRSVRDVANTSVWGQRRRQVHVDAGNKAITAAQLVATAAEAVCSPSLTHLNASSLGSSGFIDTPRCNIRRRLPITMARTFGQVAMSGTAARVAEATQLREVNQLQLRDVVFGNQPGTSKRFRRTFSS